MHRTYGHVSTWDVRKVSSMAGAFAAKDVGDLDLSFWNTRNVTDMSGMFDGTKGTVNVSTWDTRNVLRMDAMFRGASIKGDMGAWDVGKVRTMREMFKGAVFDQDLSRWDPRSITSEEGRKDMFDPSVDESKKPKFARFGASVRGGMATPAVLRLILAQQAGEGGAVPFARAYQEIVGGSKRSHWIWYVWPTLRGVRKTGRPELELPSFESARAYLRDETLRERLVSITRVAAAHLERGVTQQTLFGEQWRSDAPKYHECCSLFLLAAQCENLASEIFRRGLDACGGELSASVVRVLRVDAGFVACARCCKRRTTSRKPSLYTSFSRFV
jgi:surface protein